MNQIVRFYLEDGTPVLIEIDEVLPIGLEDAAIEDKSIIDARHKFEEAFENTRKAAGAIVKKLREFTDSPDTIELEFGLKVSAESGIVVASAAVEANYQLTLTWKKE